LRLARVKIPITAAVLLALLVGGLYWRHRTTYPHGWSHCCDKNLYLLLYTYAEAHDGRFPAGESSA